MNTDEVIESIERERARLLAGVDAFGQGASTVTVTAEGWTAKDVLAHLIHWATQVAWGLGATVPPPVYMQRERERRRLAGESDRMPTGEESNALAVAYYAPISAEEVRATFERLVDAIIERTRTRSDDEMAATDAVPWARGRPLWEFIGGDTFLHWPVHTDDLERAAGGG